MDNLTLFYLIFGLGNKNQLLDYLMIFGADLLIYLMFILAIIFTIKGKIGERKAFILFLISFPILVLIIKIIHLFYFLPRPFIENGITPLIDYKKVDASFPSRHTSVAFIMALSYFYYKSKWAPILLLFAIWIGISRIYVGVHYPFDILGGIIVSIVSLALAKQVAKLTKIKLSLK